MRYTCTMAADPNSLEWAAELAAGFAMLRVYLALRTAWLLPRLADEVEHVAQTERKRRSVLRKAVRSFAAQYPFARIFRQLAHRLDRPKSSEESTPRDEFGTLLALRSRTRTRAAQAVDVVLIAVMGGLLSISPALLPGSRVFLVALGSLVLALLLDILARKIVEHCANTSLAQVLQALRSFPPASGRAPG
jgi:hypothetical protein